ncbi:MAG: N-acetylmuramoyl-L-alanine amidase [Epulopiscium sp.]|jgi:N-acetylmuramoyl-L-alanine amidase|uniref:Spore cortex-lytic enzyme n=1 Tax=Defluviitalea raffinosedens TaxID=1450156 RepID=A0A7C8HFJ5_9FIRM|nr:spore cortex-lytic enzyme [Defluviitalea raffinosedens]MBZ4666860.1 sleB [Defluviitaleaceae bacterium]MDK2786963.1 N-acetylmuramoyl-L-alanine amidase [Candidatus Epulonipiscium sp.]KAE9636085.1 spore cortex-lytic enzyme [Defluviitalea raffinosedens]MBM7685069.1 N-acetylmuramoyl-L-alanine amidase [Defluviitalea raffinosedens]HHW67467.1 spore cortex-lytic enzyme [Candidatus Epulonipiscium sp.]
MDLKKILLLILSFAMIVNVLYAGWIYRVTPKSIETASYTWGSEGDTVRQIQQKLKQWGYLKGNVDGKYGYQTWEAVKSFQAKNGLKADGIAGEQTLEKLGIQVKKSNQNQGGGTSATNKDIRLLAAAIHGEGRGEPYVGQVAIGAVILNRVRHSSFPNSIAGVIYQPGAFDAVSDGQINLEPDESSLKAARDALNGWDPTGGATYYWNPATAKSKWIWSIPITKRIGKHVFGKK